MKRTYLLFTCVLTALMMTATQFSKEQAKHAAKQFVEQNNSYSQLFFTTHDTSLLNLDLDTVMDDIMGIASVLDSNYRGNSIYTIKICNGECK